MVRIPCSKPYARLPSGWTMEYLRSLQAVRGMRVNIDSEIKIEGQLIAEPGGGLIQNLGQPARRLLCGPKRLVIPVGKSFRRGRGRFLRGWLLLSARHRRLPPLSPGTHGSAGLRQPEGPLPSTARSDFLQCDRRGESRRSEERRVGKECRARWAACRTKT